MNYDELHKHIDKIIDEVLEKISQLEKEEKSKAVKEDQKIINGFAFDEKEYHKELAYFPYWVNNYDTLEKYCIEQKAKGLTALAVLEFLAEMGHLKGLVKKIDEITDVFRGSFENYMNSCKCECDEREDEDEDDDE